MCDPLHQGHSWKVNRHLLSPVCTTTLLLFVGSHMPENSLPFPHQTIQFPALHTDSSPHFCRTRPRLAFALWSYMILWTRVSTEQLSMLVTADTEQEQLLTFTSALIKVTPMHMPQAEGTTARASRASLSLSLPVPVGSVERSPSSYLEGNRSRTGSMPNHNSSCCAAPACDSKDQRAACREKCFLTWLGCQSPWILLWILFTSTLKHQEHHTECWNNPKPLQHEKHGPS